MAAEEKFLILQEVVERGTDVEKHVAHNAFIGLQQNENFDVLHPHRVAAMAQTEDERVVALLHDEVEDGFDTIDSLFETLDITPEQAEAILLLTRTEGVSYNSYILNLVRSGNVLAMTVKMYDLFDHIQPCRVRNISGSHVNRYLKAIKKITKALYNEK